MSETKEATRPNPGSPAAIAQGCTCAIIDNHHGAGLLSGKDGPLFWITEGCPLHAPKGEAQGTSE